MKYLTCFKHNYLSSKIFDISHRSNWPISVKTELRLFMTFPTYVLFQKCFHISRVSRHLFTTEVNPFKDIYLESINTKDEAIQYFLTDLLRR